MQTSHYTVCVRVDGEQRFLLWFTNDVDGVVCDDGIVRSFASFEDCQNHAQSRGWVVEVGVTHYDLDAVQQWLRAPLETPVDAALLLDVWNLLEDFLRTIRGGGASEFELAGHRVYSKLFRANDLPSMEFDSSNAVGEWTDADRKEIAAELTTPIKSFRAAIKLAGRR